MSVLYCGIHHIVAVTESPRKGQNSVFTQILIKDYLESSISPEPIDFQDTESSSNYWWNSKTTTKRKVVLPWNYPMAPKSAEKETSKPRLLSRKSCGSSHSSRSRSSSSLRFRNSVSAPTPEAKPHRSSGCCCWGQEETVEPLSPVDQAIQDPVVPLLSRDSEKGRKKEQDVPEKEIYLEENKSLGQLDRKLSYDSGMGSFLDNLKRRTSHTVSSLSWKSSE